MTATDELRRLLDERGVEWGNIRNDGSESNYFTEWQFDGIDGRATATEWFANENLSITIYRWGLTPAQAIDATLGRGTCHNAMPLLPSGMPYPDSWMCSECGGRMDGIILESGNYCPNCGRKVVGE